MYFPTLFPPVKSIYKRMQHTLVSKRSRNAAQVALPFPTQTQELQSERKVSVHLCKKDSKLCSQWEVPYIKSP
jgi:hypothetical protein